MERDFSPPTPLASGVLVAAACLVSLKSRPILVNYGPKCNPAITITQKRKASQSQYYEDTVDEIRTWLDMGVSPRTISNTFKISSATISNIRTNTKWRTDGQ